MGKREREYDPARALRRMRNFVVAVLLAVLAWLLLSRAYAATRADNALDELYYSTLDSRSCEALWGKDHLSPTVLASALSAYRNDRPRICIEGACSLYGYQGKDALAPFDNNYVYLFGYQDVRSVSDGRMETLSWYIEDGGDRGHSEEYPQRCVVLRMGFSQEGLGGYPLGRNPASFDRYSAIWVYDVDSKALWLDSVYGPSGDEENGDSAFVGEISQGDYAEWVFGLNGADPVLMIDRSRQAIRDVVLRGYLEGAGLSDDEVESELSEVDPIIDAGVDEAKGIYRDAGLAG